MTTDTVSTRRSLLKGGALLAAPLAGVVGGEAAHVPIEPGPGGFGEQLGGVIDRASVDPSQPRLVQRPDRSLVLEPRQPGLVILLGDRGGSAHAGAPDAIAISADGQSATGRFHFTAEIETEIPQDCTLAQMAHAQGGGFVRTTERRLLKADYVKAAGAWAIARIELAAV